jgi:Domain of unknown function (DUF397)
VKWIKSSYSHALQNCVEVTAWRTPSRSDGNGECVEAGNGPGVVGVRDSKHPGGAVLAFTPAAWQAFLGKIGRT